MTVIRWVDDVPGLGAGGFSYVGGLVATLSMRFFPCNCPSGQSERFVSMSNESGTIRADFHGDMCEFLVDAESLSHFICPDAFSRT